MLQVASMLATLDAPISLASASLRRDDGTAVIRPMQPAQRNFFATVAQEVHA
jgi:hypothetical protein